MKQRTRGGEHFYKWAAMRSSNTSLPLPLGLPLVYGRNSAPPLFVPCGNSQAVRCIMVARELVESHDANATYSSTHDENIFPRFTFSGTDREACCGVFVYHGSQTVSQSSNIGRVLICNATRITKKKT